MQPLRVQSSSQLFLNVSKPPLDDLRVRQALALTIDRGAIVRTVFEGRAEAGVAPYSPRSLWGSEAVKVPLPDLARAKALLKEAGLSEGFKLTLWIRPGGSGTNPNFRQTAELLQADWAKLGVETEIRSMDWVELVKRARAGEPQAMLSGWSGALDPDGFYQSLVSCDAVKNGYNFAQRCNPALDAVLEEARRTVNQEARAKLYRQAQRMVLDDAALITLAYNQPVVVYDRRLTGVVPTPNDSYKAEQLRWQ
jgi:ABC-type transport system substrate-binding protein